MTDYTTAQYLVQAPTQEDGLKVRLCECVDKLLGMRCGDRHDANKSILLTVL